MPTNQRTANGHRRRQLKARVKAMGLPCALCGQPIDYSRPYNARDPFCWVLDEILPVSKGGDPLDFRNVQPLHNRCNQIKGAKLLTSARSVEDESKEAAEDHASNGFVGLGASVKPSCDW